MSSTSETDYCSSSTNTIILLDNKQATSFIYSTSNSYTLGGFGLNYANINNYDFLTSNRIDSTWCKIKYSNHYTGLTSPSVASSYLYCVPKL
jgi:hypothetical protein